MGVKVLTARGGRFLIFRGWRRSSANNPGGGYEQLGRMFRFSPRRGGGASAPPAESPTIRNYEPNVIVDDITFIRSETCFYLAECGVHADWSTQK